ncbi:ABC-2 family transporter protein [Lacrimispora aerotolerans]|uniref:ABC-2 family transporter protein n=1 Tax=Lacrimispora aerotolerans TaxID=36832 RepID=UPI00047BECE7|nr:ABC-2 family transporter protein [Lacrimispora aerotolerans]
MMEFKRNIRVIKALIEIRFQNLMMFRLGFFGPFFVDGSLFLIQLMVFQAIYSNVDRIGTWGRGEMIVFIGTFSMINAINMVVYFFGINGLPQKIKNGDLDLYLTKPGSPLVRMTFEKINPGSLPLVGMSVLIIAYGIHQLGKPISGVAIAGYLFWIILMTILFYEMEVIIRSICFFVLSNANVTRIEEIGLELCMKIPGIVFYGGYRLLFCCILPYGIMATLPVQSLIGELSVLGAVYGILLTIIFTIITRGVWKRGVRCYNSASS